MKKPVFVAIFSVLLCSVPIWAATDTPDPAQQQRILEKVRQSATRYLENLPNFICARVTEQFEAGTKPDHWKRLETLTERLIFNQAKENLSLELVNGKPLKPGRYIKRPLETSGEFGDLVRTVIDEKTAAHISWSRWEDVNGHRLAVFAYLVDEEHTKISVSLDSLEVIVPYRGFLYADPETGDLWRITSSPFNMPVALQTKSAVTTIDYGLVDISNKRYLLPVSASILMDTGKNNLLNKISFTQYRKFDTESKITFVSGSN